MPSRSLKTLQLGVAGCGRIAQLVHLPELRRMPVSRVTALAEPEAKHREAAKALFPRAREFRDYRELLASAAVDALIICLPSSLHAEAALAALKAGLPVYVEKPLAVDEASARAVLQAWRSSGVLGMVGFNYRFHPLYLRAKAALEEGALGEVVAVRAVFSSAARAQPAWKRTRAGGGGALLDLASHHIDLMRYLLAARVAWVQAGVRSLETECDTAILELELSGGVLAQSLVTCRSGDDDRFEIYTTEGCLHIDRHRSIRPQWLPAVKKTSVFTAFSRTVREFRMRLAGASSRRDPSFGAALRAFVEAVRRGVPASPTLADGWESLRVVLAAEESVRQGARVELASD